MKKLNSIIVLGLSLSALLWASCSMDQGTPFKFTGPGITGGGDDSDGGGGGNNPGGSENPPPPAVECTSNADCDAGEICSLTLQKCLAVTCPGVTCGVNETLDPNSCSCVSTCAVKFEATLTLKGDSPNEDNYDFPSDCDNYPYAQDMYCCAQEKELFCPGEAGDFCSNVPDHRYGKRTCRETPGQNKINTVAYFSDRPKIPRFDLRDPSHCRVFLKAEDFPTFSIINAEMEGTMQIDMGQGEAEFAGLVGEGTCYEDASGIHIEGLSGVHFRARFYNPVDFVSLSDPEFNPADYPLGFDPQILPPFIEDDLTPFHDPDGMTMTTGTLTALPLDPALSGPLTTTGAPIIYNAETRSSSLKLVTGTTITTKTNAASGGGQLFFSLGGAALVADIEGTVVNAQGGDPVTTLNALKESCGTETGGEETSSFSLSTVHLWDAQGLTPGGEEAIPLPGNVTDGFSGTVTFKNQPYAVGFETTSSTRPRPPRSVSGGDFRFPGSSFNLHDWIQSLLSHASAVQPDFVLRRYQSQEVIQLTYRGDQPLTNVTPRITPAGGAFQLAEEKVIEQLLPGELVMIPIIFVPGKGVAGCDESGLHCQTTLTVPQAELTLTLTGTGLLPSGKISLSEITYNNSTLGMVLPFPAPVGSATYFGDLLSRETTIENTCRFKIYRLANAGVKNLTEVSLPPETLSPYFKRTLALQGSDFQTASLVCLEPNPATCRSGVLPPSEIKPSGTKDLFFFLEYCPTVGARTSGDRSQYTVSTDEDIFTFNVEGKVDKKTDAVLQLYISDFEGYSGESGCAAAPKPADLVALDGKCLYKVQPTAFAASDPLAPTEGVFSFRSSTATRDLYLVNGRGLAGADKLKIETALSSIDAGRFHFRPDTTAAFPLLLDPCEARVGSGGRECATCRSESCKKIGTVQFAAQNDAAFRIENFDFPITAKTRRSSGTLLALPTFTAHLRGAHGTASMRENKTLHVARLFAAFIPKLANSVGIASSVTPGQVAAAGASTEKIDRFALPVRLFPDEGRIEVPAAYTPVTALNERSPSGISLFNTPGSSQEGTSTYLYSFQCDDEDCRYFYAYLGNRSLLGTDAVYDAYQGTDEPIQALNPTVPSEATEMQTLFADESATTIGFFDPVTGEISLNNLILRMFSPELPLFPDRDNLDVTMKLSLTTDCVDPALIPDATAVSSVSQGYPFNLDQSIPALGNSVESLVNSNRGVEFYGKNPFPYYVEGTSLSSSHGCLPGTVHGRRMWGGEDPYQSQNKDRTGTLDKNRSELDDSEANRMMNPNFDLAGIGLFRSNMRITDNKAMYLIIKGCFGGAEEVAGENENCR
ncbi:MAG: hypothetical protein Q7S00_03705 [bacterium]|nr:hypothetical protein [bacterium]